MMSIETTTTTRVFTKQELEALGLPHCPCSGVTVLTDSIDDERKWYVLRRLVVRLAEQSSDEAWAIYYRAPTRDALDPESWVNSVTVDPWDNVVSVAATLVRKVTKMVEVWE